MTDGMLRVVIGMAVLAAAAALIGLGKLAYAAYDRWTCPKAVWEYAYGRGRRRWPWFVVWLASVTVLVSIGAFVIGSFVLVVQR